LNVWSNFKDKKVVSYIPRATGHHHHHQEHRSRDEFKPTPTPSCQRESYKMKEMKRLKMAEMRACNNNLELLSNLISVHPLVRSRHDTKASSLRSLTIQQRSQYRRAMESRTQERNNKLHPREWQ